MSWWVTCPVVWLNPTLRSKVAAPHTDSTVLVFGRPTARSAGGVGQPDRRDRLLKGMVLLAAEQEQIAHRRIVIGAMKHGIGGNAHAARHGDRVCRKPACRMHGPREACSSSPASAMLIGSPQTHRRFACTALKFGEIR